MAQPRIMPYLVTLLLLLSLPFTFIPLASGYMQSVGVRGELGCPYRNEFTMQIVIELWDRNQCEFVCLQTSISWIDGDGRFQSGWIATWHA